VQGRVVEVRPDEDCTYLEPISIKYASALFPSRGPGRVCFVIAAERPASAPSARSPARLTENKPRPAATATAEVPPAAAAMLETPW
jgi:hypothetical protein